MARASRPPMPHARLTLRVTELEKRMASVQQQLDVQLVRIAQLQAEFDGVRNAWVKMTPRSRRSTKPDAHP